MTEITKYIADDGKEFEDEDECRSYEFECKVNAVHGLKLWRTAPTTPTGYERVNCDNEGLRTADLCIIEDATALKVIKEAGEMYGYDVPTGVGMWYWDGNFNCDWMKWRDYEDAFNAFQFMRQQSDVVQS